jgi:hypothetical protein
MIRLTPIALATAMLFSSASFAEAATRSTGTTGPRGDTARKSTIGSCSGKSCASTSTAAGPRGHTATRSGASSCAGGSCSGAATYSGPAGNSLTRTRGASR